MAHTGVVFVILRLLVDEVLLPPKYAVQIEEWAFLNLQIVRPPCRHDSAFSHRPYIGRSLGLDPEMR